MDTIAIFWIAAGVVSLFAIFLFIYFLNNHKYRSENPSYQTPRQIEHYERMRDKLTVIDAKKDAKLEIKEEDYEDDDSSTPPFMQIAVSAVGIGVVLMVGYMVLGNVNDVLKTSSTNSTLPNLSSTVFAGSGLVAVGIVVLLAFGLLSIFRD